ncbi:hypothetical protein [Pseudonocardia acidicola]|uniref:Uncharacterized protein n=1 Tax=Pseudonocardia acidicola TaxID=2724939 RepID=A0ABX1SC67_9PSEU|nr:hypothetical protein [Pseudonocardia acidicola]NMH97783.1 hypothetical protein [Pseudonocardia acidicola]
MDWRHFLTRFRPAAAPGPAAPGGVPVDRAAEASAELAAVFALLAGTEAEAARIRDAGAAQARRILADADRDAAVLEDDTNARAGEVRAAAAQQPVRTAQGEPDGAAAAAELAALRQRMAERLPRLVDRAFGDVCTLLDVAAPAGAPDHSATPR